jgi:DGQHR domain-containing protein
MEKFHVTVTNQSIERAMRVPALEFCQGANRRLYAFAVDGRSLHQFSSISRVRRGNGENVQGYQRPEVLSHVAEIRRYLESENPMIPNAIVIAFDDRVAFHPTAPTCDADSSPSRTGTLEIPLVEEDDERGKPGWIVDGQQRAAALRSAKVSKFPICVVAFVAQDVEEQREQFILVNATKPLPKGLIYELLPATNGALPTSLQKRRFPAALSQRLNFDLDSPLRGMIRTPTNGDGLIADNSILKALENSLNDGVLYRCVDENEMLDVLKAYWTAVRETFPNAWALPARRSRLMHGAGVVALGFLMDTIADRHRKESRLTSAIFADGLSPLAEVCRWTDGYWDFGPNQQLKWNDLQNVPKHVQLLTNHLLVEYRNRVRSRAGAR